MRSMTPRAWAATAAVCLVLVACSGSAGSSETPAGSLLPSTADALPQLDAGGFSTLLSQQHGTPMVVNFWAAWCPPCRAEAPLLSAAAERHGDRVRFIGVDVQDNRADAEAYISQYGLPYPSVFDPANAIGPGYDLFAPPATLFFNANGDLVRTIPGQISEQDLHDGIRLITGPPE
jgi:cytochrome c biogenesis protein CcmG, thiol:disulfide interchange protein DsbE